MIIEPAPDAPAPYRAAVVAVLLGSVAWFGYGGPLGFVVPATLGGLLLAPLAVRRRLPPVEWWVLALLVGWAAASTLWAPTRAGPAAVGYEALEQSTALKLALQLALYGLLAVAAAKLSSDGARRALWALLLFMVPWSLLLLGDGLSGGRIWNAVAGLAGVETPVHLIEKKAAEGGYVLAVLLWPALGFLLSRRRPALGLLILFAGVIGMAALSAWSAVAAVIAGLAALLLVGALGGVGVSILGVAMALFTVIAPVLVTVAERTGLFAFVRENLTASWAARTEIWSFASERIMTRPFHGWGLDASRSFGTAIPLHPHDAPLQLWLELGLVGVLIAAAFWLLLARRIARLGRYNPPAGQVAAATAVAYFTVGALSFGVWQDWWLAVGAIAIVACAAVAKLRPLGDEEPSEIAFRAAPRRDQGHDLPDEPAAV